MILLQLLAGLLQFVPGVTKAVEAISRAARGGRPVKPIPYGRMHCWELYEAAPSSALLKTPYCLQCRLLQTAANKDRECPGPPKPKRAEA